MKKLFLTGWLKHVPLLEILLGKTIEPGDAKPATVPGCLVVKANYWNPPALVSDTLKRVEGFLFEKATTEDISRLSFYLNGASGDVTASSDAGESTATLFGAAPAEDPLTEAWSMSKWIKEFAPTELICAGEAISYFGRLEAAELARFRPTMLARAASTLRAEARQPTGEHFTHCDVELIERRYPYVGFYAFQEFDLRHRKFDGAQGPAITRGVLVGVEAAIVIPYDPVRDRVLLVEQFRSGPYARGDVEPWLLEPAAGMVDAGESPEETAVREAREEVGVDIRQLVPLAEVYPSPGNSSEFFYFYIGLCDIPDDAVGIGGNDGEAEDIKSHILSAEELFRRADAGLLRNAPLLYCALALRERRATLRRGA